MITLAQYERAEAEALGRLPNRVIAACRPAFFERVGYPTQATEERFFDLWADAMHEGRFGRDFEELLGGALSAQEWDIWKQIYQKAGVARGSLARAQYAFRAIAEQFKPPGIIVEIGPGSGYLTVLLGLAGFTVFAVEVTQAFYLWQALLFGKLFDVVELSGMDWGYDGSVHHVPWWNFYGNMDTLRSVRPTAVVANHCLAEMSPDAAAYLARACKMWNAPLLMEGIGATTANDQIGRVRETFAGVDVREIQGPFACSEPAVRLSEIETYQRHILGREDLRTADERWLDSIYGEDGYY